MSAGAYDWTPFFDAVRGQGPRETLNMALDLFDQDPRGQPRFAVDLGCGTGRDTLELLRRGWSVLAVDPSVDALKHLEANAESLGFPRERLLMRSAHLEYFDWQACDLTNASFSLPFCDPSLFRMVWERIVERLKPGDSQGRGGGRFAGQFFGVDDEWNVPTDRQAALAMPPARVFHTRAAIERLLEPFKIEHLEEVSRMGKTSTGQAKHWHVFHVVGRKRP